MGSQPFPTRIQYMKHTESCTTDIEITRDTMDVAHQILIIERRQQWSLIR